MEWVREVFKKDGGESKRGLDAVGERDVYQLTTPLAPFTSDVNRFTSDHLHSDS